MADPSRRQPASTQGLSISPIKGHAVKRDPGAFWDTAAAKTGLYHHITQIEATRRKHLPVSQSQICVILPFPPYYHHGDYYSRMSLYLGSLLKENIMAGEPSPAKSAEDYVGIPVPPCGEFAKRTTSIIPPPWMPPQSSVGPMQRLTLHREIEHFVAYMKPTGSEMALREDLVSRFTKLIAKLDSKATVGPVGSYVTGLFLPTASIDMVITFDDPDSSILLTKSSLAILASKIRRTGFASKIISDLHAPVPLLKIVDARTGIVIDLTGSDDHSVRATVEILSWMKGDHQVISSLVMVMEFFLSVRRLGTTYTGGVSPYLLVWMVVAWVRLEMPKLLHSANIRSRPNVDGRASAVVNDPHAKVTLPALNANNFPPIDLGAALLAFLKFYGEEFDYAVQAIQFTSAKTVNFGIKICSHSRSPTTRRYLLSITDPADVTVDMGLKAYAIKHVHASLREAHFNLSSLVQGTANRNEIVRAVMEGTLGSFLGGDYTTFISKRKRILSNWKKSYS